MSSKNTQQLSDGSIWLNSGWHIFPIDIEALGVERQIIAEKKTCPTVTSVEMMTELRR